MLSLGHASTSAPKTPVRNGKQVTFIVGFHCYDGLVMCADSLETDGYNKKTTMKIDEFFVLHQWGVMWGCSGTSSAIKNFSGKLKALLLGADPEAFDKEKTERMIEKAVEFMHATYPQERLSMLVGLWSKKPRYTSLYEVYESSNCLSPVNLGSFCCCGMDDPLANTLLDSVFDSMTKVEEAARLGIFVTSIIKERTEGVGGPTDCTIYNNGEGMSSAYIRIKIAEIEKRFPYTDLYQAILEYWALKNEDVRGNVTRLTWRTHDEPD